jgi:SAM-dependent methyltransferase
MSKFVQPNMAGVACNDKTDSELVMPRRPSWGRYLRIFLCDGDLSILRALEYEALAEVEFRGRILDFGGGEKAHYLPMLRGWMRNGIYESVNISAEMRPTYLVLPDEPFPLPPESYDMVLAINTLEHVFGIQETLGRLIRVLKPDGRVVFTIPFLYRVHGSPHDYNRPTAQWWSTELKRQGLTDIRVEPLMWDAFSAGLGVSEGVGPLPTLRRWIVPLYGLLYAWLRARPVSQRYPRERGAHLANFALGYLVQGRKHTGDDSTK